MEESAIMVTHPSLKSATLLALIFGNPHPKLPGYPEMTLPVAEDIRPITSETIFLIESI